MSGSPRSLHPDVEVVEAGRAVDREPILTGSNDADRPAPAFGVRAERAEGFGSFSFGSDGIGRDQRHAAVDGVGDEGVAEEEELFVVAQSEVIERPSSVSAHDLPRAQFGQTSLGAAAGHRQASVHHRPRQEIERRYKQGDADGEERGVDEVGCGVGSAMLFTPTKRSMHAMKTTPKAGRWWRPEETSTPIVAAITETSAISPSLGIEARALDRSVDAWKYRRSKTNNIKIEPAMSEASTVPPRSTWAKTVTASTTHATNQARRCPRRIPRAIMIIAMPATAVNAAADWATPRGTSFGLRGDDCAGAASP